jgi:hypothetical protein
MDEYFLVINFQTMTCWVKILLFFQVSQVLLFCSLEMLSQLLLVAMFGAQFSIPSLMF